jgi:hypothetical protein
MNDDIAWEDRAAAPRFLALSSFFACRLYMTQEDGLPSNTT